jgi:hypothetical protein
MLVRAERKEKETQIIENNKERKNEKYIWIERHRG